MTIQRALFPYNTAEHRAILIHKYGRIKDEQNNLFCSFFCGLLTSSYN